MKKNEYVNKIYLASVLLERNRHRPPKNPSFKVSQWIEPAMTAGFDGIEIWGNHVLKTNSDEKRALQHISKHLKIFSTYCGFEDECQQERHSVAKAINALGIKRIKYNIGKDPELMEIYRKNLIEWAELFPEDAQLLCECHAGTVIESPGRAADFFRGLSEERFAIITHPFGKNYSDLYRWFEYNGLRLQHLHIQYRDEENKTRSLQLAGDLTSRVFEALKKYGFNGSFSLEFTEGMNEPFEDINQTFHQAVSDLCFLKRFL